MAKWRALGTARLAWWDGEYEGKFRLRRESGFENAEGECEDAWGRVFETEEQISQIAATSWAGVVAIMRLAGSYADSAVAENLWRKALVDGERILVTKHTA